jgi:predicted branched-subunit amino acid permease
VRDGLGVPGLTLGATYLGLGVTAHAHGLTLGQTVASTLLAFSTPGQAALVHGVAAAMPLGALGVSILAANVRLLPLAAGVVAYIRRPEGGPPGWVNLAVALLSAATAWACVARRSEEMPRRDLASYALAVAATLVLVSAVGAGIGWRLLGTISPAVAAGLAFLAAAYFGILMAAEATRGVARAAAVLAGAILTPVLAGALGPWDVVAAGAAGAAAAVAVGEFVPVRTA